MYIMFSSGVRCTLLWAMATDQRDPRQSPTSTAQTENPLFERCGQPTRRPGVTRPRLDVLVLAG